MPQGHFVATSGGSGTGANKFQKNFSDDMRVRKILLGSQVCPQGARSRAAAPSKKWQSHFFEEKKRDAK